MWASRNGAGRASDEEETVEPLLRVVHHNAPPVERINRGEDISTRQEDQDAAAEALAAAGEFFDPEAHRDEPGEEAASEK